MSDTDPSLSITLEKGGRRRTFDIGRCQDGSWMFVETGDRPQIKVLATTEQALEERAAIDRIVRELVADGWMPA